MESSTKTVGFSVSLQLLTFQTTYFIPFHGIPKFLKFLLYKPILRYVDVLSMSITVLLQKTRENLMCLGLILVFF